MGRPISLPEAAEMMGVPPQLLRVGLQQQKFPWGVAIKMKKNYAYYINKQQFMKWLRGEVTT
mgnify:CR=1 FL=1|jgi:hypothetical protein